jgi:hypothetical protein
MLIAKCSPQNYDVVGFETGVRLSDADDVDGKPTT